MSAPFPELAGLLGCLTGEGRAVLVHPRDANAVHHFYAGVAIAPATSLLEALLLTLGGTHQGRRRYEEIVVANGDNPPEGLLRLAGRGAKSWPGASWSTWVYRAPVTDRESAGAEAGSSVSGGAEPAPGLSSGAGPRRRSGLGRAAAYQGMTQAAPASAAPNGGGEEGPPAFEIQVHRTDPGPNYAQRHRELGEILDRLGKRNHPCLLLVNLEIFEYDSPRHAQAHSNLTGRPAEALLTLQRWIDEAAAGRQRGVDLVLYARNPALAERFLGAGLPGRPPDFGEGIAWPTARYEGRNLMVVPWPCGPRPWGDLFTRGHVLDPVDGTAASRPEEQRSYPRRNLRELLRGRTVEGEATRLKLVDAPPSPPPPPADGRLLRRAFWGQVDVDEVETQIRRTFFDPDSTPAVRTFVAALRQLRAMAAESSSDEAFDQIAMPAWNRASRMLLWGKGGTGKSYLGKVLCTALFGHESQTISCNQYAARDSTTFLAGLLGSATGYIGSDRLTEHLEHLRRYNGFTVMIFDEVDKSVPGDFGAAFGGLYAFCEDRKVTPNNSQLGTLYLRNTVFVFTANLESYLPPGVQEKDADALKRRITAYEYPAADAERKRHFALWYLRRRLSDQLEGVARVHVDPLPDLMLREWKADTIDSLRAEVDEVVGHRAVQLMRNSGLNPDTCTVVEDGTPFVKSALVLGR